MIHEFTEPIVAETHNIRCIPLYYYQFSKARLYMQCQCQTSQFNCGGPSLPGGRNHSNVIFPQYAIPDRK